MKILILSSVGRSVLYQAIIMAAENAGFSVVETSGRDVNFVIGMEGDDFPDDMLGNSRIILKTPDGNPVPCHNLFFNPLTLMHLGIPDFSLQDFLCCAI